MKGFVFAAGFGERMRPLTENIPKPLLPLSGIPFICYSLMLLREAEIDSIICNVHYLADQVIDFFGRNNNFGFNVKFSVEHEILGTGGGVRKCREYLKDDDFVVINSDIVSNIELSPVIGKYYQQKTDGLLVLYQGTENVSTVSVNSKNIIDFKNFLKTGVTPTYDYTGISVLSPLILEYLQEEFSSIVYSGFTSLIEHHSLQYWPFSGSWVDVGTKEVYNRINNDLAELEAIKERVYACFGDIKS